VTHVLITNAYSTRNRGDAAIILGMLESLRRTAQLGGAEVVISSADHPADQGGYPVQVIPSFHSLMSATRGGGRLQCLYFLVVLLPASLVWALLQRCCHLQLPAPSGFRTLMRAYAAADLVIAAGGGYLYTTSRVNGNVMLLIHLHSFMMGRVLGKPVYLYAQSIGPFAARYQERLVRAALRGVRLVEARERWTAELLARWGLAAPVREAADAAFLLGADAPRIGLRRAEGTLLVGMTVRRWYREDDRQQAYERAMATFIGQLVEEHHAKIVLLPQVTVPSKHDDDRLVARRVLDLAGHPEAARLLDDDLAANEIKWVCGRMDLFVGTRMHSNIFALSMGVPVIAIAYQPKTVGILEQLGLEEFAISIDDLTAGRLAALFGRLRREETMVRETLRRSLPAVCEAAERAGRLIAEDYAASRPAGAAATSS